MDLIIKIQNKKVRLILSAEGKEQDFVEFPEENNLSEKLLPAISELLQKNKLKPKNIEKAQLDTDMSDSFTTYRIAKTVVDSFNWGKAF